MEMMLADWYDTGERDAFMQGLALVDENAQAQFGRPFAVLTSQQQDTVLTAAMQNRISDLPANFFQHLRQIVLLGYYTSEIGCKEERVYVPVPGRYDGKYPYADVRRVFSS